MNEFISRYKDRLSGTLSRFDRLVIMSTVFRNRVAGMKAIFGLTDWGPRIAAAMPGKFQKSESRGPGAV